MRDKFRSRVFMEERRHITSNHELKELLFKGSSDFWTKLRLQTQSVAEFTDLIYLSSLRKKAIHRGMKPPVLKPIRIALVGGYTFYPLSELLEHFLLMSGYMPTLFLGQFDNHVHEICDPSSELYRFLPDYLWLFLRENNFHFQGLLTDSAEANNHAKEVCNALYNLIKVFHDRCNATIFLNNLRLPSQYDMGNYRYRTLTSPWSFSKLVNLELGMTHPSYVTLCDIEFLSSRYGTLQSEDPKGWFESKQPFSLNFSVVVAREVSHLLHSERSVQKKVLVLDLDNTLWGGVVADEGISGIELGDTSPRGEAYKAFQKYLLSLKERGILLVVSSKNEDAIAREAIETHPEMLIRLKDFVIVKANWRTKGDNIREMAEELNLGLDSFVFVDDNPAEVELVNQMLPDVTTILLSPDPADFVSQISNCRLFEPKQITAEDLFKTQQYKEERERKRLKATVTSFDSYLESLRMEAIVSCFNRLDLPRIVQLINKSNQFNLTTKRTTEKEMSLLLEDPLAPAFTIRLKDRYGDYGLICVIICKIEGRELQIGTWCMSCRVLQRQVEDEVINELVRIALANGCARVMGTYIASPRNGLVKDLYPKLGFREFQRNNTESVFILDVDKFSARSTHIKLKRITNESSQSTRVSAGDF